MAKKNTSTADKVRQALLKRGKKALTARQRNAAKKREARAKATAQDYVERWRALRKLGVYNTEVTPSLKNLTPRRRREISKHFHDLQNLTAFERGRTYRPLYKETYKTPSGKEKQRYTLNKEWFHFQRVKGNRKTEVKSGLQKTKKGYVLRRAQRNQNVYVNKKGEVIEKAQGFVQKRRGLSQMDVLQFINELEDGQIKLKKGEWIIFRPYGHYSYERQFQDPEALLEEINRYISYLPASKVPDFERYSEITTGRLSRSTRH